MSTKSKKRRGQPKDNGGDHDGDNQDPDVQSSSGGGGKSKRQRRKTKSGKTTITIAQVDNDDDKILDDTTTTTSSKNLALSLDQLPPEIETCIFSYLDMKLLLRLALSNKTIAKSLRHEHVVRLAVMHGKDAERTMGRIVRCLKENTIYTPSPMRLLRLVNGKRCEYCNKNKMNMIPEHFGIFLCWHGCLTNWATKPVPYNPKNTPIVEHSRIAKSMHKEKCFLLEKPYTDSSGELCGPLITLEHCNEAMAKPNPTDVFTEQAENGNNNDPYRDKRDEIIQTYYGTLGAAYKRKLEFEDNKKKARVKADEKRKASLKGMIDTLKKSLGDVPWKEIALSHYWSSCHSKSGLWFKFHYTQEKLEQYINAPSKATKKKLQEIAEYLNSLFGPLWRNGFHDFSFLSTDDPFESLLLSKCQKKFSKHSIYLDDKFFKVTEKMMKDGSCFDALYAMVTPHQVVAMVYKALEGSISTSSIESPPTGKEELNNARDLVRRLWVFQEENVPCRSARFLKCKEQFPTLYQNAVDFATLTGKGVWNLGTDSYVMKYKEEIRSAGIEIMNLLARRDFKSLEKRLK